MTRTLAIDVGTSSVKAAVIVDGAVVASVDHAHPLSSPRPGWVEQDPGDWWDGTVATIARLNRDADLTDLDALAVTGQMQDLICLDGAGRPLRPAILYSDSRAVVEHDELVTRFGDRWSEVVGSAPDASNVAAKWSWLQRHEPDTVSACAVALFGGHSLVVHRLTGAGMCDPTTAASTALSDLVGGTWWGELVDALAIPVPPLQPVTTMHRLQAAAAKTLGLPSGLPVVHANGDAVATTLGLLGTERNRPYAYLGTSGWVAVAASTAQRGGGVVELPGLADDHWVSAAPMPAAGAVLDWAAARAARRCRPCPVRRPGEGAVRGRRGGAVHPPPRRHPGLARGERRPPRSAAHHDVVDRRRRGRRRNRPCRASVADDDRPAHRRAHRVWRRGTVGRPAPSDRRCHRMHRRRGRRRACGIGRGDRCRSPRAGHCATSACPSSVDDHPRRPPTGDAGPFGFAVRRAPAYTRADLGEDRRAARQCRSLTSPTHQWHR